MRWPPKDGTKWRKWFAWYPVVCRCGTNVWMETVWYREIYPGIESYKYALFEERPDICEDGFIPEGTP